MYRAKTQFETRPYEFYEVEIRRGERILNVILCTEDKLKEIIVGEKIRWGRLGLQIKTTKKVEEHLLPKHWERDYGK